MHNNFKKFTLDFLKHEVKKINSILSFPVIKITSKKKKILDPVTYADIEINKIVIRYIKKSFPDHNIVSEELSNIKSSNSNYTWYVDPIDGTKNLILGLKYYSVLIGLFYKKKPIYSFIFYPALNEFYFSFQNKSFIFDPKRKNIVNFNKKKFDVSSDNKIIKIVSNSRNTLKSKRIKDFFIQKNYLFKITGADSMNFILMAMKKIDIVIESGLKNIDILPLMNFLKINNIDYINWDKSKKIGKENNSLIFFNKTNKNLKVVKKFLKIIKT